MRDVFAFLGLWWTIAVLLGAIACAARALVDRIRRRRAIAQLLVDSHRWDPWAKYHARGRR